MTIEFESEEERIAWLLSPEAVRTQARALYEKGLSGALTHFKIDTGRMGACADFVARVTLAAYPDLRIPPHARWRHFEFEGRDIWQPAIAPFLGDPRERARIECECAILSVLLDAGAGAKWRYRDERRNLSAARSEGLALASLNLYEAGAFSSDPSTSLRADAKRLCAFSADDIETGFQTSAVNPLEGIEGRARLLRNLGEAVAATPSLFGADRPRLGNIADHFVALSDNGRLPARTILIVLLFALGDIWPGRLDIAGRNLGDTWPHPAAPNGGLIPFHKLSQWLSYSLFEPLQRCGLTIADQDALTGLAEYRNGGLFIDTGVLVPRDDTLLKKTQNPAGEATVEWRALTVALIDILADEVRARLKRSAEELPLASILQGGTWAAGRAIAKEKRPGGPPPIEIESDGSLF